MNFLDGKFFSCVPFSTRMNGYEEWCENSADQIDYECVYHLTRNAMQLLCLVLFKWQLFFTCWNHSFLFLFSCSTARFFPTKSFFCDCYNGKSHQKTATFSIVFTISFSLFFRQLFKTKKRIPSKDVCWTMFHFYKLFIAFSQHPANVFIL